MKASQPEFPNLDCLSAQHHTPAALSRQSQVALLSPCYLVRSVPFFGFGSCCFLCRWPGPERSPAELCPESRLLISKALLIVLLIRIAPDNALSDSGNLTAAARRRRLRVKEQLAVKNFSGGYGMGG